MQDNASKGQGIRSGKLIALLALFFFTFVLLPLEAQEKLKVEGDLIINSSSSGPPRFGLIFRPQGQPSSPQEGEIYYEDSADAFRWFDGTNWNALGSSGEKYVATRIVSAYNSLGATRDGANPCLGNGSACSNPRADYTGDGTMDNDVITAAITSLPAGGGAVYLLEGTYNISAAVTVTSNSALIGTGRGTVLKVAAGVSNTNVISCNGTSGARFLIAQLAIDGNKSASGANNNGIYFYNGVEYSKIDKVWVERMSGYGIYLAGTEHSLIFNNHIRENNFNGINMQNCEDNVISNNNAEDNGDNTSAYQGIRLDGCNRNQVSYNNARNNDGGGIKLEGSSAGNIICGNNAQGNGMGTGIYLMGSSTHHNIVTGNNSQQNGMHGIQISADNNIISGNIVYNNGNPGADYGGIFLAGDANVVSGNRIYDAEGTGYGIDISSLGSENNYILGNLIDGATYLSSTYDKRMKDLGTNTKYTDKAKISLERVLPGLAGVTTLDVSTSPKGYAALLPPSPAAVILSATMAISEGKTAGDTLMLEGRSNSYTVTVPNNANTILNGGPRTLGEDDILSLIWNGSDWVEIGWADN